MKGKLLNCQVGLITAFFLSAINCCKPLQQVCRTAKKLPTPKQELLVTNGNALQRTSLRARALLLAGLLATPMALFPPFAQADEPQEKWPRSFTVYDTTPVSGGNCVVGDATKEGMDGRAYVYLKDTKTRQPAWMTAIPLSNEHWYQNRATHCIALGGSLFVLVQTDTNQATSLSQTLLSVVELSPQTGKIIATQDADIPDVGGSYSAWVEEGKDKFHEQDAKIQITGQYFLMDDPEKRMPFTLEVAAHPSK